VSAADDVPKLPRGRGLKYSRPELFRVALLVITLVGVVLMARPCANAMTDFVMGFEEQDRAKTMPRPGTVDRPAEPQQFEQLSPDMSEEEIKAAIERSKARSAAGAGSAGSADPQPAPASDSGAGSAVER
jgi:hypothetical protein